MSPESVSWSVAAAAPLIGLAIYLACKAVGDHLDRKDRRAYVQAHWDEVGKRWSDNDGHDVGPDNRRLLEDLEAHLKAYGNEVADYYDTTTGDR